MWGTKWPSLSTHVIRSNFIVAHHLYSHDTKVHYTQLYTPIIWSKHIPGEYTLFQALQILDGFLVDNVSYLHREYSELVLNLIMHFSNGQCHMSIIINSTFHVLITWWCSLIFFSDVVKMLLTRHICFTDIDKSWQKKGKTISSF